MMEFGACLLDLFLEGGLMGSVLLSNVLSLVATWLGGGASFPSWLYKADANRVTPGRRHHFNPSAPASP